MTKCKALRGSAVKVLNWEHRLQILQLYELR